MRMDMKEYRIKKEGASFVKIRSQAMIHTSQSPRHPPYRAPPSSNAKGYFSP
ncbi:hypothetical protein RvY_08303 [Ramazzottius varieornatus]|uniref:Uncharacterized protein n=1 Tax=Ramazzottius varieornatus TaxID=947166 RepID=A0A1D1V5E0_RAMVA|nr:hypothetical protein RvY_08303 [Ramazzottius varieornatus]